MADSELSGSSRDILIEVRGLVKQLVESRDDHEHRIRKTETELADVRTTRREQSESTRRLIGWGMLLAAMAGGFGNFIVKALSH